MKTFRLLVAAAALASCTNRDVAPAPAPIVAPKATTTKDAKDTSTSSPAFAFYPGADFPDLIPRPHMNVEGSWWRILTPDDFYKYVIDKLAKLGGREVGDPNAKKHIDWLEQAFKDLLGASSGKTNVRVFTRAFEFLRDVRDPKPKVSFSYRRKRVYSAPTPMPSIARVFVESVTANNIKAEVFDASGNGACSGGKDAIVALETETLRAIYNADESTPTGKKTVDDARASYGGKLIVVRRDSGLHRSSQAKAVAKANGCGMLYVSTAGGDLIQTGSARTFFEPVMKRGPSDASGVPLITISNVDGEPIFEAARQKMIDSFSVSVTGCVPDDKTKTSEGASVVAWVPGVDATGKAPTDPGHNDAIVIGAHLDAFHEGAMDNGAGIAMLLALMRQHGVDRYGAANTSNVDEATTILSGCSTCSPPSGPGAPGLPRNVYDYTKLGRIPDIYFIAYDGEEIGLFGGYVAMLDRIADVMSDRLRLVINLETPRGRSAGAVDVLGVSSSNGQNGVTKFSPWMWNTGKVLAAVNVTYDDATDKIAKHFIGEGGSRSAPFWAWGNIFEIVRRFGGLPTDIQGLYHAQIPSFSTAAEPKTYHTSQDTLANEWEKSVWEGGTDIGGGPLLTLPKPSAMVNWQANLASIPFKTLAMYRMLWAYLQFYGNGAGGYDANKDKLIPHGDAVRLKVATTAMGADDATLSCTPGGDCLVYVKPVLTQTDVTVLGYSVDLFYATKGKSTRFPASSGTYYGFVADDPSRPIELVDADGSRKTRIAASAADGSATLRIPKELLEGMGGAAPSKFNPWIRVTAIGTLPALAKFTKYKDGIAMGEMVRAFGGCPPTFCPLKYKWCGSQCACKQALRCEGGIIWGGCDCCDPAGATTDIDGFAYCFPGACKTLSDVFAETCPGG